MSNGCPDHASRYVFCQRVRNLVGTLLLSYVIYPLPSSSIAIPHHLRCALRSRLCRRTCLNMLAPEKIERSLPITSSMDHTTLVVSAMTLLAALVLYELSTYYKQRSMPQGPFRWPLIGNILQVSQVHPWLTYSCWAKVYGRRSVLLMEITGT